MKVCHCCGGSIADEPHSGAPGLSSLDRIWMLGITKYGLPFCDEDCAAKASYAIAELRALPDEALNAMAAELRGIQRAVIGGGWIEDGTEAFYDEIFTPATDRNQSGELLEFAVAKGAGFFITFWRQEPHVRYSISKNPLDWYAVSGNDARAETVAFCAAMLAMDGRLANE